MTDTMPRRGTKATNKQILDAYHSVGNVWKVATVFGMCGQSIYERLVKLGAINKMRYFSPQEWEFLKENYQTYAEKGELNKLSGIMGRTKHYLSRKAGEIGLTSYSRIKPWATAKHLKKHMVEYGHPRGMYGKKHSFETKEVISKSSKERWDKMTQKEKNEFCYKRRIATKSLPNPRTKTTWKGGWREIGGIKKYYRSRWEANYARFLSWMESNGQISGWSHEPETFWFEGIKRGCVSYLPDFLVIKKDGSREYHEVKGWMDNRSKTKIRRMAKYFPKIRLIVVDSKAYGRLKNSVSRIVPGWEF